MIGDLHQDQDFQIELYDRGGENTIGIMEFERSVTTPTINPIPTQTNSFTTHVCGHFPSSNFEILLRSLAHPMAIKK